IVMTVLMIEAAPRRQILGLEMAEMPLAADRRLVADLPQRLRQRAFLERQAVLGPGADDADLQTVPHGVTAGHERRPSRRTNRLHVKLFQAGAGSGELVEVRRLDLAAVVADVAPAHIIDEQEEDMRTLRRGIRGLC